MLRTIFVLALIAFGLRHAARGPFYGLLLYIWIAYFRPEEWVWGGSIVQSLSLSLFVGVFTLLWAVFSGQVRWNLRVSLIALLLLQSLLSTVVSPYVAFAWTYWIDFAKCLSIVWLIASLTTDVAHFRLILLVMALSLGFEAAKQGFLQLLLNPGAKNFNEIGFLGDNNNVAIGMLVLVAILVALARTATKRWERLSERILAVGVLYRGISTYSRGGFLSAAVMALLFILRSQRKLLAIVGLAVATGVILPVLPEAFWDRMATISTAAGSNRELLDERPDLGEDASAMGRLHFWRVALDMATANPILGIGLNAYTQAYNAYDTSGGTYGKGRAVHSTWFGVVAELGYVGLVLFVVNLVFAFVACWRARFLKGDTPEIRHLKEYAAALETGLVMFVVGGSFVIFQYSEMLWHVVGLTIALHRLTIAASASASVSAPPTMAPVVAVNPALPKAWVRRRSA